DRGARSFVVNNLPDIGKIPEYIGTDQQALAHQLTVDYNAALAERLSQLQSLTNITIYQPDVFTLFEQLTENPPPGITNTTHLSGTCSLLGYPGNGTLVSYPDTHVFWDMVPPTRVSHQIVGHFIIDPIEQQLVVKDPAAVPWNLGPPPLPPPVAVWLAYV